MVSQIPAGQQIHDQVEGFAVLEGEDHVDEEWVLELGQQLSLIHHRFYAVFCNDSKIDKNDGILLTLP